MCMPVAAFTKPVAGLDGALHQASIAHDMAGVLWLDRVSDAGARGQRTSRPLMKPRLGLARPSIRSRGIVSRHRRLPGAAIALICATTLSTTPCAGRAGHEQGPWMAQTHRVQSSLRSRVAHQKVAQVADIHIYICKKSTALRSSSC